MRCRGTLGFAIIISVFLAGCGNSRTPGNPIPPAGITVTPNGDQSLELGTTVQFTASARGATNQVIGAPIAFSSSDSSVLTISTSGLACAGQWNSLSSPTVCTPGRSGTAIITASAEGVSSSPVTVYVHERIDSIAITPVQPPVSDCLSQGQSLTYQAIAYSRGTDITSTVGPFSWVQGVASVVTLNTNPIGLPPNQIINEAVATAAGPGLTRITASAAGVTSPPVNFETCPVQSIVLQVNGANDTNFTITKGSAKTITATVTDTMGVNLTKVNLTFSSSQPAVLTISQGGVETGPAGTVSTTLVGGADVTVSCTPPSCNAGIGPPAAYAGTIRPIYANSALSFNVTASSGSTAQSTTAFVTSSGCGNLFDCGTVLVPITVTGNQVGTGVNLTGPPNSFVFNRAGTKAFIGSRSGLMVVDPAASPISVVPFTSVTGKVLAVSPSGTLVVVSDTLSSPNQVFVFNQASTSNLVTLPITGATAAAFSPDSLKAYILAGSTLYVYSSLEALKTIPLAAPATDVTFLPAGAFAYIAGGVASGVSVRDTCVDADAGSVTTKATPLAIQATLDGTHLLALDPPGIETITATTTPVGCPAMVTTDPTVPFVNLGQGQFTPIKFLVSTDGRTAYILAAEIGAVLVYDIASQASSAIALVGNVLPLNADLTLDGTQLYVGVNDGTIHQIDTSLGADVAQITLAAGFDLCTNVSFNCQPDLIAIRP
jgi:hypothetical protein